MKTVIITGSSSGIGKAAVFAFSKAGWNVASYNQEQILNKELAGVNADYSKSILTYKNLTNYATSYKTIYLPTHDKNAGIRLKNKVFLV